MLTKKMLRTHTKIKEIYFQIQIWSTFGKYFGIQYKYIENISKKKKLYAHIAKYKYFFTLQIAQHFNLIRTNFPHLWIQNQKIIF